jgi:hypothetical protein
VCPLVFCALASDQSPPLVEIELTPSHARPFAAARGCQDQQLHERSEPITNRLGRAYCWKLFVVEHAVARDQWRWAGMPSQDYCFPVANGWVSLPE